MVPRGTAYAAPNDAKQCPKTRSNMWIKSLKSLYFLPYSCTIGLGYAQPCQLATSGVGP